MGIQRFSEMIRDQEMSPDETKTFAGDINNDAQRLNRMITEMLELDRIEAGRMILNIVPVDLNAIVMEAAERARAASSKHSIVTRLDPELPTARGDADRLFQAIANLLSNAAKYSAGGELLVTSQTGDGVLRVTVNDHDLGMPPEFGKELFDRYERFAGVEKAE